MSESKDPMKILIIVAHQDDEFFIASRIAHESKRGNQFEIIYLTDGSGSRSISSARNAESTAALLSLGLKVCEIHFLGTDYSFIDGALYREMPRSLHQIHLSLKDKLFDRVYIPAWEGGHPDHDACHLIGIKFAEQRGIKVVREFSLYNGFETGFLRVGRLIPRPQAELICRKLTLAEAFAALTMMRFYKSQPKTWIALAIPAAISLLIMRRECLRAVDPRASSVRPHAGKLLYEKAFELHYSEIQSEARLFFRSTGA